MRSMSRMDSRLTLCLACLLLFPLPVCAKSEGRIASGDVLRGQLVVKGTLSRMSDGERYWLVVRRGKLMWPKTRIRSEPSWGATLQEPTAPGDRFSIVLFAVTPRGDQQLHAWLETGRLTQTYPGMAEIPEGEELDALDLRVN